jgi:hypothetical protein
VALSAWAAPVLPLKFLPSCFALRNGVGKLLVVRRAKPARYGPAIAAFGHAGFLVHEPNLPEAGLPVNK